jgi:hypothetical protein
VTQCIESQYQIHLIHNTFSIDKGKWDIILNPQIRAGSDFKSSQFAEIKGDRKNGTRKNGTGKNDWGGKNSNKKNCVRYILLSISICF